MNIATADREKARADLLEHGYCVVTGVLPESLRTEILADLQRLAVEEVAQGTDYVYDAGSNQRLWCLLRKGRLYEELAQHPLACELVEEILGGEFLLGNIAANITGPGGRPMFLHADQSYVPPPWPYAMVANAVFMITDFTEENGATRVVPGTHRLPEGPPVVFGTPTADARTVAVTGPAGSMMVFDGRLWHQTGANRSAGDRRYGVFSYYCRAYMRQQENWHRSLPREVFDRATPLLRRLLGMNNYLTLGMVDGMPRTSLRY
jgi:ectoine hydroxylase-related dioxygenase (phytanoyl-CoA dioxygenase family)